MYSNNHSLEGDVYLPVKRDESKLTGQMTGMDNGWRPLTGHTYRMKSSARHKTDQRFRGKAQLHRFIRQSKITHFLHDVIDDVISDGIDVAETYRQLAFDNSLAYSLNKRKRWLLPDLVTKAIDKLNKDDVAFDVSIGTRYIRPVEHLHSRHNCSSFHSTVGNAETRHFFSQHERRLADPKSLIDNVSQRNSIHKRHDWKPQLLKLTHNRHFRGVQRKELLQNGYRRSLREILKSKAKDQIKAELLRLEVIHKPEVVYDIEYPTPSTTYVPMLQKDCAHQSKLKKRDESRLNTFRGANASKHSQILRTDLEESYLILSDWESNDPCLGDTEDIHGSKSTMEKSSLKFGDFVVPAKQRVKRSKKRVSVEKRFYYEPSSVKTKGVQSHSPHPVDSDSGISDTSTDNSQAESISTSESLVPDYRSAIVAGDELSSKYLSNEFGQDYSEGNSHPRRFTLCLSGKDCQSPSYLVLQVIGESEVGLDEVLVRLHTNGDADGFLSELFECENLLTIRDIVSSGKLHTHEFHGGSNTSRKVAPSVDMKRLNQTLGNSLSIQPGLEACRLLQAAVTDPEHKGSVLSGSSVASDSWTLLTDVVHCEICYNDCGGEVYGNRWTRLKDCGHVFCNYCWCQHLTYCIRRGDRQPLCPAHNCDSEVDPVTVLSLVDGATYRLHEKINLESLIDKSVDWRWCPNNRCGRVAHKRKADERFGLNISCECGHLWCYCCQSAAHWPATCQQAQRYADNLKEVGAALTTYTIPIASVKVKRCPKCRYPVEKFLGCNMMVCSLCRSYYCWLCLQPAFSLIADHNCKLQLEEDIDLVDVTPHSMRWFEVACLRQYSWRAQKWHIINMVKRFQDFRDTKLQTCYKAHLKRRVLRTEFAKEALSALRLYNHVIENIMVVWMSCPSKAVKHKFNNLHFVTESLEKILVEACVLGKFMARDQKRIENLIKLGDKSLPFIKLQMGRLQQAIRALHETTP